MAQHRVLVFLALAFGWSWSLELAGRQLEGPGGEALLVAAKLGPSLAGLAAAWLCGARGELRALVSQTLRWRIPAYWYAFAVFGPALLWWIPFAYVAAVRRFAGFDPAAYAIIVPLLAQHFALTGLGQELGWRGFLQATLERRQRAVGASLSVGAIWALWQAPSLLLGGDGVAVIAFATTMCFAFSLILGFVLHASERSLLIVALLHASANAAQEAMRAAVETLRDSAAVLAIFAAYVLTLACAAAFLMRQASVDGRVAASKGSPPRTRG